MDIVIIVNGEENIMISPEISSAIVGGTVGISNIESFEMAQSIADKIMSGRFFVPLGLLESGVVK